MSMIETGEQTYSFAEFEVDAVKRRLAKNGQTVSLNPKAFDLLLTLIENHGKILTKNELLDTVWENQFVEENNLTVHISALRKALGEKKNDNRFLVTVPGKGYKFVADVRLPLNEKSEAAYILETSDSSAPDNKQNALLFSTSNKSGEDEPLIGREREITEIKNLLRRGDVRLVTLTGTGGTGKTRLAQASAGELAADFPDGVFFIELAPVNSAESVIPAIAQTLGVKESGGKSLPDALKNFLRERRILLVLDNFEQILSAAPLVREILETAGFLKILVTSRAALQLSIEREFLVMPLALPPLNAAFSNVELTEYAAVALFLARARIAKPGFGLTGENAPAVAAICRRLDGLPLAIELAAARIKLLSPQAILARLETSLKLLTGGAKNLSPRRQTMRGAIEWSYDLLDEDEKKLFCRLAVFAGGFSVETAESICENAELHITDSESSETEKPQSKIETLDGITSLLEKNLLAARESADGEARLRMLEVVREFASECLEQNLEAKILRQIHARYFRSLAEEADPHLTGEQAVEWLRKLETEHDNFRAALRWSLENDSETATRTAAALRYLWICHSHLTEGCGWLKAALEQSDNAPTEVRFKLLYGLAILLRVQGEYEAARKLYQRALEEGKEANDRRQIALSSSGLGTILQLQGEYEAARKYFADGLAISRGLNDDYSIAYALLCLGIVVGIDGKPAEARKLLEESLSILRRIGSKESVSNNLNNLGAVAFDEGDYEAAQTYFAEGLELSCEVGNKINITDALNGFAALAEQRKEPELAAKLAGAAENLSSSIGFNKEPAELRFCETYTAKIRAALDEKTFLENFEQGRSLNLSEAVAIIKSQPPPKNAAAGQINNDNQSAEIVIESHTFSRILIEEDVVEETGDQILPEKIINPQPVLKQREKQKTAAKTYSHIFYLTLGAILIIALAVILSWQSGQTNKTKQFSISKLTSNGKVSAATLTPDGKYAVFSQTENDGESLWLRQIETGSQTQVLKLKFIKYVGLTVSPDGNFIYATVFGGDMPDPQIWKMPLLGGTVEEIKNIKTGAAISFSPDGKRFAFTESRSALKETHFGIADADGSNKQILIRAKDDERSFPNFDTNPAAWSPDGKEIACIVEKNSADGGRKSTILLVNPLDGSEKYVSEQHWDYIGHLGWTDAENLAFTAYTSEPWHGQIRSISRTTGETARITDDLNNYSWLASANGNLLTVRENAASHIAIGEFEENKTRFEPREIYKESDYIANVAYGANNSILYSSSESGKREIWRINTDGANRTQLTVNANITFGMSVSPVDGSIVFCSTENNKHSLKLSDAEGKNVRPLTDGAEDVFPNFTPDGQSVIFQRGLNNKTLTLWRCDLSDGKITRLTNTQSSHPAVSPDGTQTAYFFMDKDVDNLWRIGLISNSDGTFLGKINLPAKATNRRLRWHPGGKFLLTVYNSGNRNCVLLLPTIGETRELCGFGEGEVEWFECSKDGNQILISQSVMTKDIILIK